MAREAAAGRGWRVVQERICTPSGHSRIGGTSKGFKVCCDVGVQGDKIDSEVRGVVWPRLGSRRGQAQPRGPALSALRMRRRRTVSRARRGRTLPPRLVPLGIGHSRRGIPVWARNSRQAYLDWWFADNEASLSISTTAKVPFWMLQDGVGLRRASYRSQHYSQAFAGPTSDRAWLKRRF